MTRVALPCGCPVLVAHEKGEQRVVCEGGGMSGGPAKWEECPGGRGYVVSAERVSTVMYSVRALAVAVEG